MIKYTIEKEQKGSQFFLVIKFQYPRLLYRDTWLQIAKGSEQAAARFLMEEQFRFLGINPLSSSAETISFNSIHVTAANSLKALELLGSIPEKAKAEFFFESENEKLLGKLSFEGKEFPFSDCELVFPSPSPWCLYEKKLIRINADWKWIKLNNPPLDILDDPEAPPIRFKEQAKVEMVPCLHLKDRTGAFADLIFDHADFSSHEKDLLEVGYLKKPMGNSHYYCPIDKVSSTLKFLIELGWNVIDANGKKVQLHAKPDLSLSLDGDELILKGSVEGVDIKELAKALKKQAPFIELSSHSVALIDYSQFPKTMIEVLEKEKVHKREFGLFQSLLVKKSPEVARLYERPQLLKPNDTFSGKLYPYQQEGLDWLQFLKNTGFNGLLADEMGLGKTVQVLAFFSLLEIQKPLLIVMPTSLIFNWKREIEKFLPHLYIYEHQGKERLTSGDELRQKKIILTSYAILRLDLALLKTVDYECIVLDEAQNIKNPKSQAAQAAFQLQGIFKLAMTGTPIENKTDDLISLFQFLMPELECADRTIKPFVLRRTKEVIADQLPEKMEQIVWVEMDEAQRTIYDQFLQQRRSHTKQMEILETLLRLRQICCHPKLVDSGFEGESGKFERFFQDLETVLSEKRKVLVYSQFTQMLKYIRNELDERQIQYAYLDGETKEREKAVSEFQENPDVQVFLISLKAGGVGLNLTQADYVFIYDPWWNEAAERQAVDRAHRLGRKDTLIARRYVTVGTIEEKMMALKEHKTQLLDALFDSESSVSSPNIEELYQLLF